jgi:hypothetical protein
MRIATSIRPPDSEKEVPMLSKALKWPVISLLIVGGIHFTAEAILPGLREIFVPAVVAPLLLVFGLWVGYKMVQA